MFGLGLWRKVVEGAAADTLVTAGTTGLALRQGNGVSGAWGVDTYGVNDVLMSDNDILMSVAVKPVGRFCICGRGLAHAKPTAAAAGLLAAAFVGTTGVWNNAVRHTHTIVSLYVKIKFSEDD